MKKHARLVCFLVIFCLQRSNEDCDDRAPNIQARMIQQIMNGYDFKQLWIRIFTVKQNPFATLTHCVVTIA
jgi:hypothetical protein